MSELEPTITELEPTATERLRALLDERGVEWEDMSIRPYACTSWRDPDGEPCTALEGADDIPDGKLSAQALLTPEQAIAATLGQEDIYTREDMEGAFVSGYSLGSLPVGSDPRWNENRQTVDEHMAELGWVRKEAATLGSCNCSNNCTNAERAETCHDKNGFDPDIGFECTVCGTMVDSYMVTPADTGHEMQFHYCPNCGRRIEVDDG